MQRNFILTDVMKTGHHTDLEDFINMNSFEDQSFDMTGEYYTLHNYDLDSYDRRFAIIDCRIANNRIHENKEFNLELQNRCKLLHSQGFVFIKATVWESRDNVSKQTQYPEIDIEHIKWTGDLSWFWFLMFRKHLGKKFNFTHDHNGSYWHKKHDFLYLNKARRSHRVKMYNKLSTNKVLDNSLHTFLLRKPKIMLPPEYELPGVLPENYPRFGMDQDLYEPPYNDTVCSIVSETNDNNYEVFITEKIWKPIIAQHVFVVHGNYLYLQKLREMGFKTFGNYFDEHYDLEKDAEKRMDALVSLCKHLKSLCDDGVEVERGNKKWHDIYLQTQALRKHNHDTFFDQQKLSVQINKTLELFLEFADSR